MNIFLDGLDEHLAFLFGIGVIEAQVTSTTKQSRQLKVDRDGLGVAQMQKTVGLGRKPGHQLLHLTAIEVRLNLGFQEITACFGTHEQPLK